MAATVPQNVNQKHRALDPVYPYSWKSRRRIVQKIDGLYYGISRRMEVYRLFAWEEASDKKKCGDAPRFYQLSSAS